MAKAIISVIRKQAKASTGVYQGLGYVWLKGQDSDVVVLKEDWGKILPYVEDGSFSPQQVPAAGTQPAGYIYPNRHYDDSTLDQRDPYLYSRALHILQGLFPEEYPESEL